MLTKMFIVGSGLVLSLNAHSEVELRLKYLKSECTIFRNEVTRAMAFGKDNKVRFTEKKFVSFEGIHEVAKKAAEVASPGASSQEKSFEMILDGNQFVLDQRESPEALSLIQMMIKACQI